MLGGELNVFLCKIYNKKCLVQHVLPEESTWPESCAGPDSAQEFWEFLPSSEQEYHLATLQLTATTWLPFTPPLVLAEG